MSTKRMSFISKLIQFIKNAHPIKNFAKPIHGRLRTMSQTSTPTYSQVSISYESIRAEVEKPQEVQKPVSFESLVPTYSVQDTYPRFQAALETEEQTTVEAEPVLVMKKLTITPETSMVLDQEVEQPLDPNTVISQIVDLSLYQTETPSAEIEIVDLRKEPELEVADELEEIVAVEPDPVVEVVKLTRRKRTTVAKVEKKPTKAKATKTVGKTKAVIKKPAAKKTVTKKTTATKTTRTRKKKEPAPPEAMGFGY